MICPFATELLKTEKRITYDENGRVTRVVTINQPKPQSCQGPLCPFNSDGTGSYREGACIKIAQILDL